MSELDASLAEASPRLTARVLEEMYADPFWQARYGERGRNNTRQDGEFHIKYLREALAGDDVRPFVAYARWLRELLVAHGMCSQHLAENFTRLAAAIAEEPWPDRGRACDVLRAGAEALAYVEGPAAALEAKRAGIVAAIAHELAMQPARVETYVSYALDALACGTTAHMEKYNELAPPPAGLVEALRRNGLV